MRVRRWLAAMAMAPLVLVAACGGGNGTSTSNNPDLKGPPIKVGLIGGFTGTFAANKGDVPKVMDAWAEDVNARGGIDARPVEVVTKDLSNNLAGGLAAAKSLVENDKVVALVDLDNGDGVWAKYIEGTGVPVVGGLGVDLPFVQNPDFFPSTSNIFSIVYGIEALARTNGDKGAVLYCAEAPQCASAVPLYNGMSPATGVTFPVAAKVSSTAPSYTAVCEQVKESGAQTIIPNVSAVLANRLATDCVASGVKAKVVAGDGAVTPDMAANPAMEGMQFASSVAPWYDKSNSAMKKFHQVVDKYVPGDTNVNTSSMQAWTGAQLIEKALTRIPAGTDVSGQSIKDALYTLKDETLGGISPPLNFAKDSKPLINCYFVGAIKDGTFVSPDGLKTQCAPDELIKAIVDKLPAEGNS